MSTGKYTDIGAVFGKIRSIRINNGRWAEKNVERSSHGLIDPGIWLKELWEAMENLIQDFCCLGQ
jgi:hypothetical protein